MAKKKRSSNPNLKYSQASKRDEGTRILEAGSIGDGAEFCVATTSSPSGDFVTTTSSPTIDGGTTSTSTSGRKNLSGAIGSAEENRRSYCSSPRNPDLPGSEDANSSSSLGEACATFNDRPAKTSDERATVQVVGDKTLVLPKPTKKSGNNTDSPIVLSNGTINSKGKKMKFYSQST